MARFVSEEPGFQAFVRRAETYPLLDSRQELALARRWRTRRDRAAADALVHSHLRSVIRIAQRYRGYGIYLSDLVAEGNLGLLRAVDRFEPERGLRFLTYARYWIRAFMLAHILKHWSIVDLGTTALQSKLFFRLQGEHARLTMLLGEGEESIEGRLAAKFATSVDQVRESLERLGRRDASLDVPVAPEGGATFLDLLAAEEDDQEAAAVTAQTVELVHEAVARAWPALDCRERLIVRERLLPEDGEPETLAALGRQIGVTRERVRQLEAALKDKLRVAFETVLERQPLRSGPAPLVHELSGSCGDCPAAQCAAA